MLSCKKSKLFKIFITGYNEKYTEYDDDWDCEKVDDFIDDMPTNDSCSCTDECEERDNDNAEKYLREIGVLVKIEDDEAYFDLNFESDFIDADKNDNSKNHKILNRTYIDIPRKLFDDPLGYNFEFNPVDSLEQLLKKNPINEFASEFMKLEQKFSFLNTKLVHKINISESINKVYETWNSINKPVIQNSGSNNINLKQKKLTEFAYLLQRKGFRLMRKYYKDKFENFAEEYEFKAKAKLMTLSEINVIMINFIHTEFSNSHSLLSEDEFNLLLHAAKCLIFSDRSHKKRANSARMRFFYCEITFLQSTQRNRKSFLSQTQQIVCFIFIST